MLPNPTVRNVETPAARSAGVRRVQPREAFGLLASEYDRAPNALISLEQRTMAPLLPDVRGKITIDVGAGSGRWAKHCASRGAFAIAVDFCHELLLRSPAPAVEADARRLPLPDSCADLVICAFALGYAIEIFAELRRIVRPGGMVLASDVHPAALQRGWTRTFRHKSGAIEVAHQPYSLDDLRTPDLRLTRLLEPRLGPPERAIFEQAGREKSAQAAGRGVKRERHAADLAAPGESVVRESLERFAEASQFPAIFVAQWIRM